MMGGRTGWCERVYKGPLTPPHTNERKNEGERGGERGGGGNGCASLTAREKEMNPLLCVHYAAHIQSFSKHTQIHKQREKEEER